jgi:hypothetical protein
MAWFLQILPRVELLLLTATMAASIGLGLAMARATIFLVFFFMTRDIAATNASATASLHGLPS